MYNRKDDLFMVLVIPAIRIFIKIEPSFGDQSIQNLLTETNRERAVFYDK
jgi:hypothetical protein